jgi:hypothetical protein
MANLETQLLDDMIVKGRRKMMALGIASIAGLMLGGAEEAHAATYTDNDILNFALNLEYLEANFYYIAAFGCTIDKPNQAAITAGAPSAGIPISLTGGVGTAGTVAGSGLGKAAIISIAVGAYATETAIEEGKHVLILQKALGSLAVNQPAINLGAGATDAWPTLATAAKVSGGSGFSPYANDAFFLVGAYVFEDVGVTAYHGAASLLTGTTTTLPVAAGILAVEAYHAGLVRTTINAVDPTNSSGYITITNQVSALRASLANTAAGSTGSSGTYDPTPDDYGLASAQVMLGSSTSAVTATHIVDCDLTASDAVNSIAFARTTTQVLAIVTGGGKVATPAAGAATYTGVFFPNGLNAGANGFK